MKEPFRYMHCMGMRFHLRLVVSPPAEREARFHVQRVVPAQVKPGIVGRAAAVDSAAQMTDVAVSTALVAAYVGVARALLYNVVMPTFVRTSVVSNVAVATVLVVARIPMCSIATALAAVSALAVTITVVQTFDSAVVAVDASLFGEGHLAHGVFDVVDVPAEPAGVGTVGTGAARRIARRL